MMHQLLQQQLEQWPLCRTNFEALSGVQEKSFVVNDCLVRVQFNPERMRSTGAKLDKAAIAKRPCFLCDQNLPSEQIRNPWHNPQTGNDYQLLINPFPIFPLHLTIPACEHTDQTYKGRLQDMLALAKRLPDLFIFYNGAQAGASAPDHMHFQAGNRDALPLLQWQHYPTGEPLCRISHADPLRVEQEALPLIADPDLLNLVATYDDGCYTLYIINRRAFRPWQYTADGDQQLLVSPATVEMGGIFICPVPEHFERITAADIEDILRQCYLPAQPRISVGILGAQPIQKEVHADGTTTLRDVKIGIGFHWERHEDQTFRGEIVEEDGIAINRLPIEDYLESVISSEMAATSSIELLKAHAVISRSWALNAMRAAQNDSNAPTLQDAPGLHIKIYERDAHRGFDVCADDHCQRYQGITRMLHAGRNEAVRQALEATRGQVLTYDGELCDARFSKCCGGTTELFSTCWADRDYPYLRVISDPYCDTHDAAVLRQVLNGYDQETHDFHDWTVRYTDDELTRLLHEKSGIDFGTIKAMEAVERGPSGRIKRLRIVGEKQTMVVGKELEIRKWLSPSHLYSSAFEATHADGVWTLTGHGWGHGVGLCQIGAAVMASQGIGYEAILAHYFPGATLSKWW